MAHPKIEAWFGSVVGRRIDVDKHYGLQCKDVIDDLCMALWGNWTNTIRPGDAKFCFDGSNPTYFEKIRNSPTGVPPRGSVIVWNGNMGGGFGHIAVVTSANVNSFSVVEQDGFRQVAAYTKTYPNYAHVIGWLIPKLPEPITEPKEGAMNDQQFKDAYAIVLGRNPEGARDGRTAMQFIYDAKGELQQQRSAQAQQVSALSARVSELEKAHQDAAKLVNDLQAQLVVAGADKHRLTKQVEELNARVEALGSEKPVLSLDGFTFGELALAAFAKLAKLK